LVSPSCPFSVFQFPIQTRYALGLQLGRHLRLICLYLPPTLSPETISSVLACLPLTNDTIICGDLNARLGAITGDTGTNTRGNLLQQWCSERSLSILNSTMSHGQPTFLSFRCRRSVSSVVDYFITNMSTLHTLTSSSLQIYSDLSLGSDHKLMSLSFDYQAPVTDHPSETDHAPAASARRMWNLSRFAREDASEKYVDIFSGLSEPLLGRLQQLVDNPPSSCPPINELNAEFNEAIYSALDKSVGTRAPRPSHWKKFWTPALQTAAELREVYYRKWRRCASSIDKLYWWNLHQKAHIQFRQDLRKAKQQSWRLFCDSLANQDVPTSFTQVKQLKARRQTQPGFVHPDGPSAGANAMRDHLASVYSGSVLPASRPPVLPVVDSLVPFAVPDGGISVLSADNIAAVIKTLPRRKAPGPDSLRTEMLLPIRSQVAKILSLLFTICYQWSNTPLLWRQAQVVPIHKKGDVTDVNNYRPISLTSVIRKLFEMCLSPFVSSVSPQLDVAQGGFRAQRSALDQALCLHDLIQDYYQTHHHYPVCAYLDIKAAYDTVDRRFVWQSLLSASAPLSLVSLLANLFDEVSVSVILANHVSTPFTPCTGVLQGSVLSPHLYSVYINSLAPLLRQAASGFSTRVLSTSPSGPLPTFLSPPPDRHSTPSLTPINLLLYADDVALIGSANEIQQMLSLAESHSMALGYRWSPPKCAVVNPPSVTSSRYTALTLYGEVLPEVKDFTYLGVPFTRKGIDVSLLVTKRQRGVMASMAQLNAIGANRSGFSMVFSARLYASFARPKLEYGLAIARLTKSQSNQLEKIQNSCLRMIFGGHKTSSTTVFKHLVNLPNMSFRADVLVTKYCIRANYLPPDCLLSLLSSSLRYSSLSQLRSRRMVQDMPTEVFSVGSSTRVTSWLRKYRQELFDAHLTSTDQVLIRACRPVLKVDPIMYLPASRADRSRLIRWRMGWLPGKPKPCPCSLGDHTSRRHLLECPNIPADLWLSLPVPPGSVHRLDYVLSQLPLSPKQQCPRYWVDLCTILWHIDQLCNPDGDYTTDPLPGDVWNSL
jgi:hypothetical protein